MGATAALGFLLRTYSIAWCTLPIMRSGVGRGKRSEFGPSAAVWPSNIVKARFHKMLHKSISKRSFLAVKTQKLCFAV